MGAAFEYELIIAKTENELSSIFDLMVNDALYEYGHNGYTGTFAEKTGLVIEHPRSEGPLDLDEAIERCTDENEKYGPASAYFIKDMPDRQQQWLICGWCSE